MAPSLTALAALLVVAPLSAQQVPPPGTQVIHFTKEADAPSEPPPYVPLTIRFTKQANPQFSPTANDPLPTFATRFLHFSKEADAHPAGDHPVGLGAPQRLVFRKDASPIRQVAMQAPPAVRAPGETEEGAYQIQLLPPGKQRLFQLESEASMFERMRQEALQRPQADRVQFPEEPILSEESFKGRYFPPMAETVEPAYVCYGRLLFEDINAERYGWDLGWIQPFASAGIFFLDNVFLPYHAFTDPCRKFECNAGYCLPGDPVPYLLYPPELSLTGALAQTVAVVGIVLMLP